MEMEMEMSQWGFRRSLPLHKCTGEGFRKAVNGKFRR